MRKMRGWGRGRGRGLTRDVTGVRETWGGGGETSRLPQRERCECRYSADADACFALIG